MSQIPVDHSGESGKDLSVLAWVQGELRKSLDVAHKTLRRFVKDSEALGNSDVDSTDTGVLRNARSQIHQGVGALELVGQPAAAVVLRATEALVERFINKPHKLTSLVIDDIERASFAVFDYLERLLSGKSVSPLALFPQYRLIQEAAGADRLHPADLWLVDWHWRELPPDSSAHPREHNADTRGYFERLMLPLIRESSPTAAAAEMSDLAAGLGAVASQTQVATLWKLTAAVFEAQAQGLLGFDVFTKRVVSRLLAQYRSIERGDFDVSERLAQDLLFFCAQSLQPNDRKIAPRLVIVRDIYELDGYIPVDYTVSVLGCFDPAVVAQARKRVVAAKESWSAVAGGEMHRLAGLSEQFTLVGESLKRLFPLGEALAGELQNAVTQAQRETSSPSASLAMEVATSLLYIEAVLEDGDFDHPMQAERVSRLAERLAAVRHDLVPDPLETWMEELYRRISDRQTMGSVVHELRASLSESEKLIDQYFRDSSQAQMLVPVPNQLSSMRGVLSVLGMDQASMALLSMCDEVESIIINSNSDSNIESSDIRKTLFDRLAGNLGALGFLIDMLSVQPQMAKSLFIFDPKTRMLSPVMGRRSTQNSLPTPPIELRLIEQAQMLAFTSVQEGVPVADVSRDLLSLSHQAQLAEQPMLTAVVLKAQEALDQANDPVSQATVRGELSESLVDFVHTVSGSVELDFELSELPENTSVRFDAPSNQPDFVATPDVDLTQDDEMREIFLEEAHEVLTNAQSAYAELRNTRDDLSLLTTLRRAFHTLKGSARMVGLNEFGEAAWAGEQLYNTHLADQTSAPQSLLEFTEWAINYLSLWVTSIAERRVDIHTAGAVIQAVKRITESHGVDSANAAFPVVTQAAQDIEFSSATPDVTNLDGLNISSPQLVSTNLLEEEFFEFGVEESIPNLSKKSLTSPALPESKPVIPTEAYSGFNVSANASINEFSADINSIVNSPVVTDQDDDQFKLIGTLRISLPLFNIYLNEADDLSRRLTTELADWAMELNRSIGDAPVALAHSLAGSSATVGFMGLSQLARGLEHAQARSLAIGHGTPEEARLFVDVAEEIRRLLHQFAAGFLSEPVPALLARLADHEISSAVRLEAVVAAAERSPEPESGPLLSVFSEPQPTEAPLTSDDIEHDDFSGWQQQAEQVDGTFENVFESALTAPAPLLDLSPAPVNLLGEVADLKSFVKLSQDSLRASSSSLVDDDDAIDAVDAVDEELFPIFDEEAEELLPQLASRLRDWAKKPDDSAHPAACMRVLHTLKGGARLAGAMRLGEMTHRLETKIQQLVAHSPVQAADVEALESSNDALSQVLEALRSGKSSGSTSVVVARTFSAPVAQPVRSEFSAPLIALTPVNLSAEKATELTPAQTALGKVPGQKSNEKEGTKQSSQGASSEATNQEKSTGSQRVTGGVHKQRSEIDWTRFTEVSVTARPVVDRGQASQSSVRVRAPLLDRLVNQAGEVSITRSRIETSVTQIKNSLSDLTENLERLRAQLRDIEFHGEMQMTSRLEAAKAADLSFDPLEFDRFTRFQELTRMMAESVNDVATVQRTVQRSLETTEDELVAQARMTRELQDDLLRTRMVEFEGLSDRLYRVVRLAAKETGKSVRLDIVGGSIEVDRGVLDRMTGCFEHLLRNCVSHGIESPEARIKAGKEGAGSIVVALSQEGNEVGVEFRDDGAGLNLARIRAKGEALGLLNANSQPTDAELANLIFAPGFSTAEVVTELSGRGVGMDVVRSEVNAIGGRIETATTAGQGTSFKMILPLTTAVTQVVMLRCGNTKVAVPSTLIEVIRRATPAEIEAAYLNGLYTTTDRTLPFFWLGALLQLSAKPTESTVRSRNVIIIRSAQQRIALHVDEVLGNQEVVVKNLGPQLENLPGLAGVTLLASGDVALIYNPVALATLYGDTARATTQAAVIAANTSVAMPAAPKEADMPLAPLVMVVDDSLTVRRVTQRMLLREGYRVVLAKDGLDALERLAEGLPEVVLSDIEMPRMDGFDLVRNIRADSRLCELPIIMITSRIAQKHRDYAAELGVEHYLGKPYSEEDLLGLIAKYTRQQVTA
jgi:chemosensory pili system protein ChpA (sensor histidine kinase/response regulator)